MNTPNPLVPQGTFADKGKQHIRITVFAILAVHVVLLGVLLIAGCDKKPQTAGNDPGLPPTPPPAPTDWPPSPVAPPTSGVAIANSPTSAPPPGFVPGNPPGLVTPPGPGSAPVPGNNVEPPPAGSATVHTVVKGDSFYTLGKQYKVGYQAIAKENPGVDSSRLKIGQKVNIPAPKAPSTSAAPAGGVTAPAPVAHDGGEKTYTVKSQDTLTKIAKVNGTTVPKLRAANNLKTDQLKVGQKLKIPSKAAPPIEATSPPSAPPPFTPAVPEGTAPAPGLIPVTNR